MWPNPQETADFMTFTEEIFNGELYFLCSAIFGIVKYLPISAQSFISCRKRLVSI